MEQVLICLEEKDSLRLDVLSPKQRGLVALGKVLLGGPRNTIARYVEKALDAGASREEIMKVAAFIVSDERLFGSITELLRALGYEENKRAPWISVVDDVREE